jgi:hypothetical protein
MAPERQQEVKQARGEGFSAAWAAMTPERQRGISAARARLPATPAQTAQGSAVSAENATRVAAGREGVEAHVLQMLQATCSSTGKWNISAAYATHKQQGGGMSNSSFYLAAGRLRDRQLV